MPEYEVELHDGHGFHKLYNTNGTTSFLSLAGAKAMAKSASRLGDPVRVLKVTRKVVAGFDRSRPIGSDLRRE